MPDPQSNSSHHTSTETEKSQYYWTAGHWVLLGAITAVLALLILLVHSLRADIASLDVQTPEIAFEYLQQIATDDVIDAAQLDMLVERAEMAEARASGYLGIFEALSFATAVFGGLVVVIGFSAAILGVRNYSALIADIRESRDKFYKAREDILSEGTRQVQKASLALALMPLAHRQYIARDLDGALQTYERVVELDPQNPIPHYHIGYIYTQKKDFERAENALLQAQKLDDRLPQVKAGLGFVYRRRGDQTDDPQKQKMHYRRAEQLLIEALTAREGLVDDDGESWWGVLGGLEKRRGNYKKAIDHYKEAMQVTPQSSYPFLNLGLIELELGDIAASDKYFDKALNWSKREILAELGNYWAHGDSLIINAARGKEIKKTLDDFLSILPEDVKDVLERVIDSLVLIRDKYTEYDKQQDNLNKQREIALLDEVIEQLQIEQKNRQEINSSQIVDEPGHPSQNRP